MNEYLSDWLDFKRFEVRQSTYEALTVYVNHHLIPHFGSMELEELSPADVYDYMRSKLETMSTASVRKHLSILRQALNDAVCRGLISVSPCVSIRMPRTVQQQDRRVFYSPEDARRLLDGLRGGWLYPVVLTTLLYGLRRSEVIGLRWDAVDFENNTITVRHTVVKYSSIVAADSVKSDHSYRRFELLPEVRRELLRLPRISPYIFAGSCNGAMRPDSLTRSFRKALNRLDLPPMRFHDLRHSTASILFDLGWSLEDVREWLGHADIETTSNGMLSPKCLI